MLPTSTLPGLLAGGVGLGLGGYLDRLGLPCSGEGQGLPEGLLYPALLGELGESSPPESTTYLLCDRGKSPHLSESSGSSVKWS